MADVHKVLQVFVASPGDVVSERESLEDVIREFNITWGDKNRVLLNLVKWETHTYPDFGNGPQDVINTQIGDSYDIFLGIMWTRFGTPTQNAESGTEEEFNRAYNRLKDSPKDIKIMFYFKDAAVSPSKVDGVQLQKVHQFKEIISVDYGGLYHEFETTEQFQTKVRMHLSKIVQDWLEANESDRTNDSHLDSVHTITNLKDDPLKNLRALNANLDEDDILDIVEVGIDAMSEVNNIVTRMTDATADLGNKFQSISDEAKTVSPTNHDLKNVKKLSNKAANDLEIFVKRTSVEIVEFNKQSKIAMDSFGKVAMMAETETNDSAEDIAGARQAMIDYIDAIQFSVNSLSDMQSIIDSLPRMTSSFNRARKRAVAVIDDLLYQFNIAINQSHDVEELLARLESKLRDAYN